MFKMTLMLTNVNWHQNNVFSIISCHLWSCPARVWLTTDTPWREVIQGGKEALRLGQGLRKLGQEEGKGSTLNVDVERQHSSLVSFLFRDSQRKIWNRCMLTWCCYQGPDLTNDGLDHDQHPDDEDLDQDSLARVTMCGDRHCSSLPSPHINVKC